MSKAILKELIGSGVCMLFLCASNTAGMTAETAVWSGSGAGPPIGGAAKRVAERLYVDEELGFSVLLPGGWYEREQYLKKSVLREKNLTRSVSELIPWMAILVTAPFYSGEGKGDSRAVLARNAGGLMKQRMELERAQGATVTIVKKPRVIRSGKSLAGTFTLACDSLFVDPAYPLQDNIVLTAYMFPLHGGDRMLSFCFYSHGDGRFAEERRVFDACLDSVTVLPAAQ